MELTTNSEPLESTLSVSDEGSKNKLVSTKKINPAKSAEVPKPAFHTWSSYYNWALEEKKILRHKKPAVEAKKRKKPEKQTSQTKQK